MDSEVLEGRHSAGGASSLGSSSPSGPFTQCLGDLTHRGKGSDRACGFRHNGNEMEPNTLTIAPEERTLAALTHLSGLSGYVIPLGGVLVPIIIWAVKSDSKVISSIAKQALLLNFVVFVLIACTALLWITVVLIPAVILFWIALGLAAIALPIVGAIKALDGGYFRYPVVGVAPAEA
jgi:uncharacterized protein